MALLLLKMVPLFAKIGQLLLLKAPIYPDENDTGAAVNSVTVIDTLSCCCKSSKFAPPPLLPFSAAIINSTILPVNGISCSCC
jgi:hypothetical protein